MALNTKSDAPLQPKSEEWNNFKSPVSGMDKYGAERLKLAVLLRDKVLTPEVRWTIENGNLLGAWRSGKFILHDDDFDIAVFYEKDGISCLEAELQRIKKVLPSPYQARLVSTYTHKIEVFDPSYGSYILSAPAQGGADYHHVTADIQAYQREGDGYRLLYNNFPRTIIHQHNVIFPTGSIILEGEKFPAPHNVEAFLKQVYGSLSSKAKYDRKLGLYVDQMS
jgi:hypothetical protein